MYVCMYVCESEVITWILSIPLDYVLVVVVDDGAEVSDATCVPFDRIYAVGGLEPKVDVMQTLGSLEICPLYIDFGAIPLPYAHSHPPRLCNFVAQA